MTTHKDFSEDFLGTEEFLVLVPKDTTNHIAPKSGICAKKIGTVYQIDFEGNLYGAENLKSFEQRIFHAASRSHTNYPTVARIMLAGETVKKDFNIVGIFNHALAAENLKARRMSGTDEAWCLKSALDIFPEGQATFEAYTQTS